jgi:hypothetical protein
MEPTTPARDVLHLLGEPPGRKIVKNDFGVEVRDDGACFGLPGMQGRLQERIVLVEEAAGIFVETTWAAIESRPRRPRPAPEGEGARSRRADRWVWRKSD